MPAITGATHYDLGDSTVITGTAAASSTVEVFTATGIVDPTGYGEGVYLATANADVSGNWSVTVPAGPTIGDTITSVCIDQNQNTSEFSPYYTVQNVGVSERCAPGTAYLKVISRDRGFLVSFGVPQAGKVVLKAFGLDGRLVPVLWEGSAEPGSHELTWEPVDPGIYLLRMEAGGVRLSRAAVVPR